MKSTSKTKRNRALDFVKGAGVIVMIIHHSLDYFHPGLYVHRYVRFITGLFIFVTGFMVTHIYLRKYLSAHKWISISSRLLIRGLKILALFVALNLAVAVFIKQQSPVQPLTTSNLISHLYTVFISGDYQVVDFSLLVPISYVLLLAGILVFVFRGKLQLLVPLSLLMAIFCSVFFIDQAAGFNLRYVTIGMLGAALGFVPTEDNILQRWWQVFVAVYILHLAAIAFVRLLYPVYLVNVVLTFIVLYLFGSRIKHLRWVVDSINLMGMYSLFGYLLQIAVLQVLIRVPGLHSMLRGRAYLGFILTLVVTLSAIHLLDVFRKKSQLLSRLYGAVFS